VSVQARGDSKQSLYEAGCRIADLGGNLVVKVPIVMADGSSNLDIIHRLSGRDISVNTTACMSANQAMLAAAAGARYVSLLAGRIEDAGGAASEVISTTRSALSGSAEIIIGSIRDPAMVWRSALAGADIATISPAVLDRMMSNDTARRTVAEFDAAEGREDG
jgi:transaldolase